jgi:hypothetical protein
VFGVPLSGGIPNGEREPMEYMSVRAHRGCNKAARSAQKGAELADNTRAMLAQYEREARAMLAQLRAERRAERDAREMRHYGRTLKPDERLKLVKDRKSILRAIVAEDLEALERHRLRLRRREARIRRGF